MKKTRLLALLPLAVGRIALASSLHIAIDDVRSSRGEILIAVYNKADGFPGGSEGAVFTKKVAAKNGQVAIEVPDLERGDYAVALHHDENGDGKMNYSFVGMPKEGFGFSGNKKIFFGPPSFSRAKVVVGSSPTNIEIKMKYF